MKAKFTLLIFACACVCQAQIARLGEGVDYEVSLEATAGSGDVAPLWFTSNKYGLGSTEPNSAQVRAKLIRSTAVDSLHSWRFGYGLDVATGVNHANTLTLQQVYVDARFKMIQLSVGQKERPMELKNQELSSGGLTSGINARPIPQVRLELPDFWTIPRTGGWLAIKAHVAYGMFTDNDWQRNHVGTDGHYAANVLYHSKAGFLRIGNTDKFPITLTGGLEASAQFGGTAYNVSRRPDDTSDFDGSVVEMGYGAKAFWQAFFMSGSDAADGDYANVAGNQLGSWHLRADYDGKTWGMAFYAEHFFEDHSQLFMQYAWKDMLYGGEVRLPKNRLLSTIVYEHLRTTDQSGSIYHDHTTVIPDQISSVDNYYNHGTYTGWHHAGYALGNPLLLSPVYNAEGEAISFQHNRVKAHHIGLQGEPTDWLAWRFLCTREKSLGTYVAPLTDPQYGTSFMAEMTCRLPQVKGLAISLAYGQNSGDLLGNAKGAMLTVSYGGRIGRKAHK